jgi:hypothetical protein
MARHCTLVIMARGENHDERRTMMVGRYALLCACLFAVAPGALGSAVAATGYSDRVGDVKGGAGPDIVAVHLSNTATKVTFRVRFAKAPPLRASAPKGWADMLLIAIDVPPLGPRPLSPGGEWPGADFALGTHGPSPTGMMVRLGDKRSRLVSRFKIDRSGSTLTFSIPRRPLGSAASFTFLVAAARETENEATGGGTDFSPGNGTFRYVIAR